MLSFLITALIFIASFLVILSFLVFFHELGHYSVARLFGVAVERFSIGFGKPITKWKAKSGTEWVISRIPLGGYVKFLGDAGAASNPDLERLEEIKADLAHVGQADAINDCFHFKPLWQRALIVLAGPLANFLLAIVIFSGLAMTLTEYEAQSVIIDVAPDMAAEAAGFQIGDHILTLNGEDVSIAESLLPYIAIRSGVEMIATVKRGGDIVTLNVTPNRQTRKDAIGGDMAVGTLGITIGGDENVIEKKYGPIAAVKKGTQRFTSSITTTTTYIGRIFTGKEDGRAFGGPIRIATMTGKTAVDTVAADMGWKRKLLALYANLFTLAAAISIGLGVANLMPIPALDGGHLLYYGYEAIAGRPLSERKQEYGFRIGFAIILTLLIYLTINDFGYVRSMTTS